MTLETLTSAARSNRRLIWHLTMEVLVLRFESCRISSDGIRCPLKSLWNVGPRGQSHWSQSEEALAGSDPCDRWNEDRIKTREICQSLVAGRRAERLASTRVSLVTPSDLSPKRQR